MIKAIVGTINIKCAKNFEKTKRKNDCSCATVHLYLHSRWQLWHDNISPCLMSVASSPLSSRLFLAFSIPQVGGTYDARQGCEERNQGWERACNRRVRRVLLLPLNCYNFLNIETVFAHFWQKKAFRLKNKSRYMMVDGGQRLFSLSLFIWINKCHHTDLIV